MVHRRRHGAVRGCLSGDGCRAAHARVDLMGQVESYIAYILAHQAADGWLGRQQRRR